MNLVNNVFAGEYNQRFLKSFYLKQNDGTLFNQFPVFSTGGANWQKFTASAFANQGSCPTLAASTESTYSVVNAPVKKFGIYKSFCKDDLAPTVLAAGFNANTDWSVDVQAAVLESLLGRVGEQLYIERWVGNTSTGSTINGIYTLLDASTTNIDVAGTAITTANVFTELNKVVAAIPAAVKQTGKAKIIITPLIADAIFAASFATPMGQTGVFVINGYKSDVFATYMGVDLVIVSALVSKPNTMIAGIFDNSEQSALGWAYNTQEGLARFKESADNSSIYLFEFKMNFAVALLDAANTVFYKV